MSGIKRTFEMPYLPFSGRAQRLSMALKLVQQEGNTSEQQHERAVR